ncbi:hypothetical protein DPEC_G00197120 [Dallia pectoralis]|uniref:Uncharacterized protein n=1 Tax=Dallia pectoralis TaxID=75939 RepID=A0ACC2G7I8_DALPE|nr:hypothetical protein DPEC_G00197120 [Dallia pectoralis]
MQQGQAHYLAPPTASSHLPRRKLIGGIPPDTEEQQETFVVADDALWLLAIDEVGGNTQHVNGWSYTLKGVRSTGIT